MQQRQLRLGDILDDYCPRERRVTNHAVVALIGEDVKQVRCTTCDADHEFKHAKVPRQRRKTDTPAALYAQVLSTGPKRVTHEAVPSSQAVVEAEEIALDEERIESQTPEIAMAADEDPKDDDAPDADAPDTNEDEDAIGNRPDDEGPAHRRLIRASLPKIDGAPPPTRAIPEFTSRQPAGRPTNRFRGPRGPRGPMGGGGGQQFQGNRSGGGGGMRSNGGRPPQGPSGEQMRRNGPGGRRRPK